MNEVCKVCGLPKELCMCSQLPKNDAKKRIVIEHLVVHKNIGREELLNALEF